MRWSMTAVDLSADAPPRSVSETGYTTGLFSKSHGFEYEVLSHHNVSHGAKGPGGAIAYDHLMRSHTAESDRRS